MIERTELRSDIRALGENEIDLVTGGFADPAANRAVSALWIVTSFGGSHWAWGAAVWLLP